MEQPARNRSALNEQIWKFVTQNRIKSFHRDLLQVGASKTRFLKGDKVHHDPISGSGFKSSDLYNHGFFSAKIKLPSDYTAGVVVAFYASNGEIFEKTHDELDFEFLGNVKRKRWRFQTNVYGNGSTSRGREERYFLWFDPSKDFHRYTILWTSTTIIFYIDEIPIREISRSDAMAGDYPSKPMSLYATIWDASDWATSGGKYKVNYKYAPFVAEFTGLVLHGCATDPIQEVLATSRCSSEDDDQLAGTTYAGVSPAQRMAMKKFRRRYMYYSYCYDTIRYPIPPPECVIDPLERLQFRDTGRLKFSLKRRRQDRRSKRRNQVSIMKSYGDEDDD
ncbi:probable xyloglucan endotransglucosylase/hydrolase protein 30 isoform X1 [Diospyros lotus]|uniref:probable xyloglucan endotransglucosylase/hydrolase protein 30 isoform X1 n=1 Tax=Diospyros lotus TaxID=55363 RepID=UPI00225C2B56|nr:probable xyloglucan endotransglucosylase/hydrolase protein 30 isoform X1 [Diospyros lotus]